MRAPSLAPECMRLDFFGRRAWPAITSLRRSRAYVRVQLLFISASILHHQTPISEATCLTPSIPIATATLPVMATEAYKYRCHLCPKAFTRSSNLNYHVNAHEGIKPSSCSVCHERFNREHDRNQHIKEKHTDCPLYYCRQKNSVGKVSGCGRGFKRERDLERHRSSKKGQQCRPIEPESVQATHTSSSLLAHQPRTPTTTSGTETADNDIQHRTSSAALGFPSWSSFAQQPTVPKSSQVFRPSTYSLYNWSSVAVKAVKGLVTSLNATFEKPQSVSFYAHALPEVILHKQHELLMCTQILLKRKEYAPLALCVNAIYTVAALEGDMSQIHTHARILMVLVRLSHESGSPALRSITRLTRALGKYSPGYRSTPWLRCSMSYASRQGLNDRDRQLLLSPDTGSENWKFHVARDVRRVRSLAPVRTIATSLVLLWQLPFLRPPRHRLRGGCVPNRVSPSTGGSHSGRVYGVELTS